MLRRRILSEADRRLWQVYTNLAQVAPMPGKALPPLPQPSSPGAAPPAPATSPAPPRPAPARATPELQVGAPPPGIDARRWRALRRGKTRPERVLDLHGRRAQEAHADVRRFLVQAQADGLRCVAIVTGKGSSTEGGVLRRELPFWLNAAELRPLVLGAAHPHASNPGAVHLLLRRRG
ncbi:Smr/MutS family protein [Belnapia sp. T6]|uniref:Smr/MutS family protein n=1 Tax=Belnapia mucosa TaxID=2804532 RepID=A0ABS1V7D7_9PROT|nr:Smr/MutS family protein [Belnapia mucosa]MBL6457571.1 Smr/MutS family protein [Belnapia mucosa]